ncbi:MAG: hypothetical protein ABIM49_02350 [candidate division WOR-3 bacterium]
MEEFEKFKKDIEKAIQEYIDKHFGESPDKIIKVEFPIPSDVVVEMGKLIGIVYFTKKGNNPPTFYYHTFKPPFPILAFNPDDKKSLFISIANFEVKKEGIVG